MTLNDISRYIKSQDEIIYDPSDLLGSGNFGTVYKIEYDDQVYAYKLLKEGMTDMKSQQYFLRELSCLSSLHHPCIPKFGGFVFPTSEFAGGMLTEYIGGGDLKDAIENKTISDPNDKARIAYGIAHAMKFMHSRNLIHRDLKPDNILLSEDLRPYVTDFGLARGDDDDLSKTSHAGFLPMYKAPEILNNREYTKIADLYSYGIILYQLYYEISSPFGQIDNPTRFAGEVITGRRPEFPEEDEENEELGGFIQLIRNCWAEVDDRLDFDGSPLTFDYIVKLFEDCIKESNYSVWPGADAQVLQEYIDEVNEGFNRLQEEKNQTHEEMNEEDEQLFLPAAMLNEEKEKFNEEKNQLLSEYERERIEVDEEINQVTEELANISKQRKAIQEEIAKINAEISQASKVQVNQQARPQIAEAPARPKNIDPSKMTFKERLAFFSRLASQK